MNNQIKLDKKAQALIGEIAKEQGGGGDLPIIVIPDGVTTVTQEEYDLLFPEDISQQRPQICLEHFIADGPFGEIEASNMVFYFNGDYWSSFIYAGPLVVFQLDVNNDLSIFVGYTSTFELANIYLDDIKVEDNPNRVYGDALQTVFWFGKLFDEEAGELLINNNVKNTWVAKSAILDDNTYLKVTFDDHNLIDNTYAMTREFISVGGGHSDVLCFDMDNYSTQSELNSGEWDNATVYKACQNSICFIFDVLHRQKAFVSFAELYSGVYTFKLTGSTIEPGEESGFGWDQEQQCFFYAGDPQ